MTEQILQIGQGQGSAADDLQPRSRHATTPFESGISLFVSVMAAVLLCLALGSILWFSATVPKLARLEEPERALDLMVSRIMEAQDGLQRAPAWEQRLAEWMVGSSEKERLLAIQWYQELADATADPSAKLRLAILLAENGRTQEALDLAAREAQDIIDGKR